MRRVLSVLVALLVALAPLAAGAQSGKAPAQTESAGKAGAKGAGSAAKSDKGAEMKGHQGQLDLNAASEDDLKTLPGIGEATAKKIVENRPYKRKDELVRKKILPSNVYEGIKEKIVAHQS